MDVQIEELKALARLDRLPDLDLLLGEASDDQRAALRWLMLCQPPGQGPVVPEAAVRRCLGLQVRSVRA